MEATAEIGYYDGRYYLDTSHDFINLGEVEFLKKIKAEEYDKWQEFYDEVTTKALNMLNICTLKTTKK